MFLALFFYIAITNQSKAQRTTKGEIYTTLTGDTTLKSKKDSLGRRGDSLSMPDTPRQKIDTFHLKLSKDTLDAQVDYQAIDSGVLLVKEKKFLLYGKTITNYKDITLTAPRVEFDQATNILTAVSDKDSMGNVVTRAVFKSGNDGFQSDTIRYNFKTQRGITTNTYSKMQDMFVKVSTSKKVDSVTTFAKHFTMTTCDYDDPHFGFVASKGKFINNKTVVTGPIHPEFEGVPIPIYLPFGFFPINKNRHSGFIAPQFTVNQDFGIGLDGIGYYQVLNEYVDATIRGSIYSYGGWNMSLVPTYRKLYKYSGAMNFTYQYTKYNFKGDPDYSLVKTFNISWNHSMDQKARPGVNFMANVNAGSTRFNEQIPNSPARNLQNQMSSSITFSKLWKNLPFNLSLSANHNQNNQTRLVNIILPDAGFTVSTLYPFQKKESVGSRKWWEKIGFGYSTVVRNQTSFYDDTSKKSVFKRMLDTLQWGAQHRFPINVSLPSLGPLLVSPFVSYEETWLTNRVGREWDSVNKRLDTIYEKQGLFIDRQMNFGIGLNTALYGTAQFKKGKIMAIRHTMRPNISFSYKPNMSKKYYDVIKVDTFGRTAAIPQFGVGNMFSQYGYGKFGGITFGLDNNLEWKLRKKNDTLPPKRSKLIDGFGFTSGYNFLQDSMKLLPFNLYARTTLFEKISITAQALYNPYQQDSVTGGYINRFVWQGNRFSLGRLNSGSVSMSTSFQSKPRDPDKSPNPVAKNEIKDPNLVADQERMRDYIRRNPADFVDFNIPWQLSVSYSLSFSKTFDVTSKKLDTRVSSNTSLNGSFSLTPKWNFSTTTYYDFDTKDITMLTMTISRDMHCWQMSVNVTPVGYKYFSINISPKSPLLQDLKVNRTRYFSSY